MSEQYRIRFYCGAGVLAAFDQLKPEVKALLDDTYVGYTMYPHVGMWDGIGEPGATIEVIVTQRADRDNARHYARRIAKIAGETCVLVTCEVVSSELIYA